MPCPLLWVVLKDRSELDRVTSQQVILTVQMDYLFYTCLLLFATDVRGVITNPPLNAVAEVGQQAIFNCTSDVTIQNWILATKREDFGSAAAQNLAINCVVQPGFTTHYEVDRPGGNNNICNLIVKDTTMQQAGIYTCSDTSVGPSAILTVTDTLLNATYNTTAGVVVEKDKVIIECVLNYNGTLSPAPTLRPYFYWTNSTHNVSSSYDSTTDNTAVSQLTVTAGRQDITPFTCHVYFQLMPPTNAGYANNTPAVSNSSNSPIITVHYCPGNIGTTTTVSTADNCVYKQENLTCTAEAYPPAQYEWLDLSSNSNTSGPVKSIASGGRYQCTASNTIRNQPCSITATVTEYDCYPVDETNMTMGGPDCTNGSCYCTGSQPLELTCHVYSMPAPTYRWYWNGALQIDYFGNQTIRPIYDGTYSCTANSSFGTTSSMATASANVDNCTAPPTTTAQSTTTKNIESTTTGSNSTSTAPNKISTESGDSNNDWIVGVVIGCFLGINILMTCFFIGYYTIIETTSATTGRSGTVKTRRNKDRLNKRFPWLQKMLPCLNDTKEAAGTNFPWVLLFTLLATLTGIVTFPVWIALSIKSETNNEMSVLKRDEEVNENTGNGTPTYTPVGKRTKASHPEDPYQNSAENIELKSSLHSRNHRPTDSPTLNASIRGKPPPPPKNKPTVNSPNRSMDYTGNGSAALNYLEPTTYAELPIKPGNTGLTPSPVQLLVTDDPSDNYAVLNKT